MTNKNNIIKKRKRTLITEKDLLRLGFQKRTKSFVLTYEYVIPNKYQKFIEKNRSNTNFAYQYIAAAFNKKTLYVECRKDIGTKYITNKKSIKYLDELIWFLFNNFNYEITT